jgi:hypothetical protein
MSTLALTSNTLAGSPGAGQIEYNGQFYATDSNSARGQVERITQGTAVASTSGTSITFTGIPAWAKKITIMFNGVSTSGTSQIQIQLGSGSVTTTGYNSGASYSSATNGFTPSAITTGLILEPTGSTGASSLRYGSSIITLLNSNLWAYQANTWSTSGQCTAAAGGVSPTLSSALDRVVITTVNGTDTFDAGSINIMYEG